MDNYQQFLKSKDRDDVLHGFEPLYLNDNLFDFQKTLVEWSIRKGRGALFAGCGLGKSVSLLTWSENVLRHTNKSVLVLTPLAVSQGIVSEGKKFGIECRRSRDGKISKGITVTNYEKLERFDPKDFSGLVCDESSCLKGMDSKRRKYITEFMHKVKYRLLCSATPAPNDYMELGNSSEALGYMGRQQMLGMFFTNGGESTQQWELKGHARKRFWRWMASWARAVRKPSDLGFNDDKFILPELTTRKHVVSSERPVKGFGLTPAVTLEDQLAERRATVRQRCEKVAELVTNRGDDYSLIYCHLNPEGDLLEKIIPDSVQIQGKDRDEVKEERLTAFMNGQIKRLISKPKISGHGLNLQFCNHVVTYPSHSHEFFFQSIRRCWRFGQKRPVTVDIVTSDGEQLVLSNMLRKERQQEAMYEELVKEMTEYQLPRKNGHLGEDMKVPIWLKGMKYEN